MGSISILMGICVYSKPVYYDYRYARYVDFTGYNKPYGIALIAAGILLAWKSIGEKNDNPQPLICPKCEEPFAPTSVLDRRCPKCGTDLEPLKGFYKRNPERKKTGQADGREQDSNSDPGG